MQRRRINSMQKYVMIIAMGYIDSSGKKNSADRVGRVREKDVKY